MVCAFDGWFNDKRYLCIENNSIVYLLCVITQNSLIDFFPLMLKLSALFHHLIGVRKLWFRIDRKISGPTLFFGGSRNWGRGWLGEGAANANGSMSESFRTAFKSIWCSESLLMRLLQISHVNNGGIWPMASQPIEQNSTKNYSLFLCACVCNCINRPNTDGERCRKIRALEIYEKIVRCCLIEWKR